MSTSKWNHTGNDTFWTFGSTTTEIFHTVHAGNTSLQSYSSLTPSTPATLGNSSKMSDVESLDSNDTTSVTPEFSRMKLGRGWRGPRKELIQHMMDNFPKDGTEEEKAKYICKKQPNCGTSKKLTSGSCTEYRAKGNVQVTILVIFPTSSVNLGNVINVE